ncbi:MAG: YceI family protein [Verrucomicrobiota bacterium]
MTTQDLESALAAENPPVLLDVRLEDDFNATHIPGAINTRVFEVTFLDQAAGAVTDKSKEIVTYGFGGESHEAQVAAEKLKAAGYTNVRVFEGGLKSWTDDSKPVEGNGEAPAEPAAPHGKKNLDLGESKVEWLGRNLLNKHWGTLGLQSGSLEFDQGSLICGEFIIDMEAIACTDLAGDPLHDVLVDHLKNDDFFDVEKFPTATFVINEVTEFPQAAPSEPNIEIGGDLSLKGVTNPLSFPAVSGLTPDGQAAAQAAFGFDRTAWGVIYGSGKFFHRLAGHMVGDMIEMQLRMVCEA